MPVLLLHCLLLQKRTASEAVKQSVRQSRSYKAPDQLLPDHQPGSLPPEVLRRSLAVQLLGDWFNRTGQIGIQSDISCFWIFNSYGWTGFIFFFFFVATGNTDNNTRCYQKNYRSRMSLFTFFFIFLCLPFFFSNFRITL